MHVMTDIRPQAPFVKVPNMLKTLIPVGLLATTVGLAQAGDTIPELASSSGRLDTLVSVVKAADLAGALSSEGPFGLRTHR